MVDFNPGNGVYNLTANDISSNAFIAKYDSNDSLLWAFDLGGNGEDFGYHIKADDKGMIYVTGGFAGTNIDFDPSANTHNLSCTNNTNGGFIVKYDGSKEPQDASFFRWAFNLDAGLMNSNYNTSYDIFIDKKGMVYLTGYFSGNQNVDFDPGIHDFIISNTNEYITKPFAAKYDGTKNPLDDGFFQWAFSIDANSDVKSYGMFVDSMDMVYISGYFTGKEVDFDPSANSYKLNSNEQDGFVAKYNGQKNPSDPDFFRFAFSIGNNNSNVCKNVVVDNNGMMYITGEFEDIVDFDPGLNEYALTANVEGTDIFVAKYDANKNPSDNSFFQWAFQIKRDNNDVSFQTLLDKNNMLYITGNMEQNFSTKVDFDPSTNNSNTAHLYDDIFIVKYNVNKNPSDLSFFKWAFTINYSQKSAFCIDDNGNVLLTGSAVGEKIDFDPSSNQHLLSTSGGNGIDWNQEDIFVAKYNGNSTPSNINFHQWNSVAGNTGQLAETKKVTTDRFGNIYAIGTFQGKVTFSNDNHSYKLTSVGNDDIFIVKYNNNGDVAWAFSLGWDATDYGSDIIIDSNGMVYIAGLIYGYAVDFDPGSDTHPLDLPDVSDIFIAKYDGNKLPDDKGFYQWAFATGGQLTDFTKGNLIALDSKGMLFATGSFTRDIDIDPSSNTTLLQNSGGNDVYVAKYDASKQPGNISFFQWGFKVENCASNNIIAAKDGSLYLIGSGDIDKNIDVDPTANVQTVSGNFAVKYDVTKPANNSNFFKWAFQIPAGLYLQNSIIDNKNMMYLTGEINSGYECDFDPSPSNHIIQLTNTDHDFLLAKYNLDKNPDDTTFYQWAFNIGYDNNVSTPSFTGKDVAVDSTGMVYALGYALGSSDQVDIDPGININYLPFFADNTQAFVFIYDGTKKTSDTTFYQAGFNLNGNNYHDRSLGNSIQIDSSGNFLLGGTFTSQRMDFDPNSNDLNLTSTCNGLGSDAFVVKYSPFQSTLLKSLELSGKLVKDKTKLNWQTVGEVVTAFFEIEWSNTDPASFAKTGTVNAIGSGNNAYVYTHSNPTKGKNLYRLKIFDQDGSFKYSNVIEINYSEFEILNFSGVQEKDKIQLGWKTRDELNISSFEIEWSTDSISFKKTGTVNSVGDGNNAYQYLHTTPASGKNFYRLKAVDKDGGFEYSDTLMITYVPKDELVISIGPNPVITDLMLHITSNKNTNARVEIINRDGKLLYFKDIEISVDTSTQHFGVANYIKGVYFVRVKTPDKKILLKFVK